MAQPLRCEDADKVYLITTRTIGSKLWFVNNKKLEERILAFLARYQELYGVIIYGFIIMGNHYHLLARFPQMNKADFMRAFNAIIAKLVAEYVPNFKDGRLWARRYAEQVLPREEDIEHWFFYCALNPVISGLVENPKDYPSYNSFHDAIQGTKRRFKIFLRMEYNEAKRNGQKVNIKDFIRTHTLSFSKLPSKDELYKNDYQASLLSSLRERCTDAVVQRRANGKNFAGLKILKATTPGTAPQTTKKSHRYSLRPLVLCLCAKTKELFLSSYFSLLDAYKDASEKFRKGFLSTQFPVGTYRPILYASS